MTIFVDDANIQAKVGRVNDRWCHLVSDLIDPEELHRFAESIGLRRAWFQHKPDHPEHDHYDVTRGMRFKAIRAGATAITTTELAELIGRKRAELRAAADG